jgi:hypothetical protein
MDRKVWIQKEVKWMADTGIAIRKLLQLSAQLPYRAVFHRNPAAREPTNSSATLSFGVNDFKPGKEQTKISCDCPS